MEGFWKVWLKMIGVSLLYWLLGAVHQSMAACQNKLSMANYSADLMNGKYYLIFTKLGFPNQYTELRCSTSEITSAAPIHFHVIVSVQEPNGTVISINANATNIAPPGTWQVSSGDGQFQASVIGAIKRKVNVYYACNAQNGKEAVWVYYYKRVNGANEMDDASLKYALDILAQNRISIYGFNTANNKNCTT